MDHGNVGYPPTIFCSMENDRISAAHVTILASQQRKSNDLNGSRSRLGSDPLNLDNLDRCIEFNDASIRTDRDSGGALSDQRGQ